MNGRQQLDKIINHTFFNHKGFIVERIIGGFKIMGKSVFTMEQVDKVIDDALTSLKNSIK